MTSVLHHYLTESPWSGTALRKRRLELMRATVARSLVITLVIDETGDRKKGNTTDYVARQYSGNFGKIDNCKVCGERLWHCGTVDVSATEQKS